MRTARRLAPAAFLALAPLILTANPANAVSQGPTYGALAFSASVEIWEVNMAAPSREEAQREVLNHCISASQGDPDYRNDCRAAIWVYNGYVALVYQRTDPRQITAWGTGWGHTSDQALSAAKDVCSQHGPCDDPYGDLVYGPTQNYDSNVLSDGGGD
jgi:Domain of unknown function (DUF4189)